jgi:leader peptidase (prepilin peptidase)/N-methyltransferase
VATLAVVASGLVGLIAGWFTPLVAYRWSVPAQLSHRTACVSCERPLPWLAVSARCPRCRTRWGPPAWLMASLTALSCAVVALVLGPVPALPLYVAMCVLGALLGAIDVACHRLPHGLVFPATWLSLLGFTAVAATTGEWTSLLRAIFGAVVLGGFYLLLYLFGLLFRGGLGWGDVKLAVLLGLFLGWLGGAPVLLGGLLPSLLNAPLVIGLLVSKRIGRQGSVPFGPAMLTGALVAIGISGWADLIGRTG